MNINTLITKINSQRWTIGFIREPLDKIIQNAPITIDYVKHKYKDRWFADPFILDVDDKSITLLVEEFYYPIKMGRIAKLTIDKNTLQIVRNVPVLQVGSHLSFPAIIRNNDGVFLYPENGKGEGLNIYKSDDINERCELIDNISHEPLADAIITDVFGNTLLFTTRVPKHNGNTLLVYDVKDGQLLYNQEITFSSNLARNAGDWFLYNGEVYRPAQDCNISYGKSVILQKVELRDSLYVFSDIRTITSQNEDYNLGCHTFNQYKGIAVVDSLGFRYKYAQKIFMAIYRIYHFIFKQNNIS